VVAFDRIGWPLSVGIGGRIASDSAPREPNLDKRLCDITFPTLIQWGGKDTWVPVKYAELLRKGLPNVKLIVYPELGHVIMEEEPRRTATDADAFLDETDT
jgi:pimeloyl-ACP methyl ester carboxylesterase